MKTSLYALAGLLLAAVGLHLCKSPAIVTAWILSLPILTGLIAWAGHGVTGNWMGALIDNRNLLSLSRFQMLAWTVLVLSAFLVAVIWNAFIGEIPDPVNITLPPTLWLLMGISTTSTVASPLILNTKKSQQPDRAEMSNTKQTLSEQGYENAGLTNQGLLLVNASHESASWRDLITGEETGNSANLDLSRIQLLLFTLAVLLGYGAGLLHLFAHAASGNSGITAFPELSEGMTALIGISHVGYLSAKALPHSQTADQATAAAPAANPAAASSAPDDDIPALG